VSTWNELSANVIDVVLDVARACTNGQGFVLTVEHSQSVVPVGPGPAGFAALYTEAVQVNDPGWLMSTMAGLPGSGTMARPAEGSIAPGRPQELNPRHIQ
jgi:hypothetical protein